MLRHVVKSRPRRVPFTPRSSKVYYSSQTSTQNTKRYFQEKVAVVSSLTQWSVHIRTRPKSYKYPEPDIRHSRANRSLHPEVENGLLSVRGRRSRFVVSVTLAHSNEMQFTNTRPVQVAGSGMF